MQEIKEKCLKTIELLCSEYENDDYIMQRLDAHVNATLGTTLRSEKENYEKRVMRTNYLLTEQSNFATLFLSNHLYYYLNLLT